MDLSKMWQKTRPRQERSNKHSKIWVGATTRAGDRVKLHFHLKYRLLITESPAFMRGEFVKIRQSISRRIKFSGFFEPMKKRATIKSQGVNCGS